jgi:hypothetical protein
MKVKTLSPVQHDGKEIEPGTTLDLASKAAAQLIAAGAAEGVGADKGAGKAADGADTGSAQ